MLRLLMLLVLVAGLSACTEDFNPNYQEELADAELYHASLKKITDIMVYDIFSPPQAGRIYAYTSIAGYEAMAAGDPSWTSLAGQVTDLETLPQPEADATYCFPISAIMAQLKVGRALIFSGQKVDEFEEEYLAKIEEIGAPKDVVARSIEFGEAIADHILAWTKNDMYAETRSYPKFTITGEPGRWEPTPPDYMPGIEPSWNVIRPLTLDSAAQYKPLAPTEYNEDPSSEWWAGVIEVYEALNVEDEVEKAEREQIAEFWDCNPYATHHRGHLMFATKKISPGGHWMNITSIAARKANANFAETVAVYALTGIALHDGFISCWDEKYRSSLVRPETFINKFIDQEWEPLLQTPPFPEHTSGHSVVSRASATVLTDFFGDDFAFDDDSEVEYGLPIRSFPSFMAASEEAAVSRLYGGIHYRPAIDYGVTQGENVGRHVLDRLSMRQQFTEAQ